MATNTGGRYSPISNTWKSTTMTGAPLARSALTAVWTGSEVILWGASGIDPDVPGGRYDPLADSWRSVPVSLCPGLLGLHSAAWTGMKLIVWGGLAEAQACFRECIFI